MNIFGHFFPKNSKTIALNVSVVTYVASPYKATRKVIPLCEVWACIIILYT